MTNKQILESIRALAQGECIHHDGESCRVTRRPCHVVHPHSDSLREAIGCDFFLRYMLPAGWNIQDLIAYARWYGMDEPKPETDGGTDEHVYPGRTDPDLPV